MRQDTDDAILRFSGGEFPLQRERGLTQADLAEMSANKSRIARDNREGSRGLRYLAIANLYIYLEGAAA